MAFSASTVSVNEQKRNPRRVVHLYAEDEIVENLRQGDTVRENGDDRRVSHIKACSLILFERVLD
jgi:hypothetical protein